jgi:hypothetical protein
METWTDKSTGIKYDLVLKHKNFVVLSKIEDIKYSDTDIHEKHVIIIHKSPENSKTVLNIFSKNRDILYFHDVGWRHACHCSIRKLFKRKNHVFHHR